MAQHVKILAILFIVFGIICLAFAAFFFFIGAGTAFAGANAAHNDEDRAGAMFAGGCMGTIAAVIAILGLPNIIAGWGLLKYRNWARILTIVLAILNVLNFPFGTALAIYALWVLFHEQTQALFARRDHFGTA